MAFCPNCGTPNTDQAEKCVACGFELIVPKQKAKFKGTIMMSGIKAPTLAELAGATTTPPAETPTLPSTPSPTPEAPAAPASRPPAPAPAEPSRNYNKTMLGHAPVLNAAPASPTPPAVERPVAPRPGLDRPLGSTMLGSASIGDLQARPPPSEAQSAATGTPLHVTLPSGSTSLPQNPPPGPAELSRDDAPSFNASPGYASAPRVPALGPAGYESTLPPPTRSTPPNPATILGIGCAVALALFCVVGGILYYVVGAKLRSMLADGDGGAEAAAWQASIVQSLAQVSELCKSDCAQAGVYFHPLKEAALCGEAKALTPERVQKLSDPTQTQAAMLDGTDDAELATKLGLDPQQCARVSLGAAKIVSCSVPDPAGQPSVLRIVHLGGIATL